MRHDDEVPEGDVNARLERDAPEAQRLVRVAKQQRIKGFCISPLPNFFTDLLVGGDGSFRENFR
jgi:hypothetical protein